MNESSWGERVSAVAALDDPVRRALYEHVSASVEPVGRDAAADATGLPRSTAAFHLDRLAEQGLLSVTYRRLGGRTGPGAGRPAKLYFRSDQEVAVSIPPRQYDLAGEVLAEAVEESVRTGVPVAEVLPAVAARAGRRMGEHAKGLWAALRDVGFEPRAEADGSIALANCPFHRLAQQHRSLVCGLNLDLVRGLADGVGDDSYTMTLDPAPSRCCVRAVSKRP